MRAWATGVSARPYILIRQPDLLPGLQMLLGLHVGQCGDSLSDQLDFFGSRISAVAVHMMLPFWLVIFCLTWIR